MPVRCGNHKIHGKTPNAYHETSAQVALCFKRDNGLLPIGATEPAAKWSEHFTASPEEIRDDALCEHQMSASLCAGPDHYPSAEDERNSSSEHMTTAELMRATSDDYHRRGEGCPWDCSRCPGNIAADEAEARQAEIDNADLEAAISHAQVTGSVAATYNDVTATAPKRLDHPVWDGIYTYETSEGHRTFRLRTQGAGEDFAPGRQVIAYLSGSDNDSDYTGFGFVESTERGYVVRVWKRFKGNHALVRDASLFLGAPDAALQSAHCFRCHRTLTVPASIHAGLGPECAKKAL